MTGITQQIETDTKKELLKCDMSCHYFIDTYVQIYDATAKEWIPFHLWDEQEETLEALLTELLIIILKARQLGLTWLCLGYILWLMLFRPIATALLFSRRDTEAMHLLGDERLKGMYNHLPAWMRFQSGHEADSAHDWILPNKSNTKAFPTSAGDSYTASVVLVDEADLVPNLNQLMRAVKPTIDGGGQLILLSRSDKSRPNSEFKNIYRAAKQGLNGYKSIFLPWHVRPSRDKVWYEAQKADILHRTASLDDLHEQYPATDTEALAPRTLDKRLAPVWLQKCHVDMRPLVTVGEEGEPGYGVPAIPGLRIFKLPEAGRSYKIGIDPAEGNPTSDDSSLHVVDDQTGEECAVLKGKFQPQTIAAHADTTGLFYNKASVLPERNNHGHAVILWLDQNSSLEILKGEDGKPGWLSSSLGKTRLYDEAADTFKEGNAIIHSFDTFTQLSSIEGSTLRAPEGEMDDLADSYVLAQAARRLKPQYGGGAFLSVSTSGNNHG